MATLSPTSIILLFKLPYGPTRAQTRVRWWIAGHTTISPLRIRGSGALDCVLVGIGISGRLCIAQALATRHSETVPNVIVTEAGDHVGGNITTVESDGYLWEEGPVVFNHQILSSLWRWAVV